MKTQDNLILFVIGSIIWVAGTIYYAYRGTAILESTPLRYWISFLISTLVSAVVCIAILRLRHVPHASWAQGMLLLAIPGMIGESIVLSHFSTFMPKLQETSAGRYGAFLFATYALVLGIAELVTIKAIS